MGQGTDIDVYGAQISPVKASETLTAINEFGNVLRQNLVEGQDYDVIIDGQSPVLLKPGAEKIVSLMGLYPEYEIITEKEGWDTDPSVAWPIFYYKIRCWLRRASDGKQVGEGLGSCNNAETKYRFKRGPNRTRMERDGSEAFDQVNTVLKIAEKRALVHATLTIARVSGLFTQDIEDLSADDTPDGKPIGKVEKKDPKPDDGKNKRKKTKHGLDEIDLKVLKDNLERYPQLREKHGLVNAKANDITREQFINVVAEAMELDEAKTEEAIKQAEKEEQEKKEKEKNKNK